MKTNLPEKVNDYIETMKSLIYSDKESYNDIFGKHEWIDEEIYWGLFEAKAMSNWQECGDPALSPEQFKSAHLETATISMEQSLQNLVSLGLIEQETDGFKVTDVAIEALKRGKNSEE